MAATVDAATTYPCSAARISNAQTPMAAMCAASIGKVGCRPCGCSEAMVSVMWPIAWPAASMSASAIAGERRMSMDDTTAPTLAQANSNKATALSEGAIPPPPIAWAAILTAPDVPPTKAPRNCATSAGPGVMDHRIPVSTTTLSRCVDFWTFVLIGNLQTYLDKTGKSVQNGC